MLNFIVSGVVPGTSIEVTLNWFLVFLGIFIVAVYVRRGLRHRQVKRTNEQAESISQLA
jgi:hypothetical protein